MRCRVHRPGNASGRHWLGGACLVLCLAACSKDPQSSLQTAAEKPSSAASAARPKPASYADQLVRFDAGIARGIELANRTPEDSLVGQEIVSLYLERALLTGDDENFAQAEAWLVRLAQRGKPGGALCLLQARLHFSLHRLKAALATLDACPSGTDRGAAAALRANIDFQAGRYRQAEQTMRALLNQDGLSNQYVQLALLRAHTGAPAEAAALLEAAEKRYHAGSPMMQSWLRLQRGLVALERGRLDEALALYLLANDALPGWWLVEEHRAEALHLLGRTSEAKAIYERVVASNPLPDLMDALAAIERESGNAARADDLQLRARARHEERMNRFPEAAIGHGLKHFLMSPDQRGKALELARKNHALRPGGESAIGLARALLANAQAQQAVSLLEGQRIAGWDTAELHWVMSLALRQAGHVARADAAAQNALARNPLSPKMYGD